MPDSAGQHFVARHRLSTSRQNVLLDVLTMSSHNRAQISIQSPVAVSANITAQCVLPRATRTDGPAEDLQMGERFTHFQEPQSLCQARVDKLPDDVLLDIFAVYLNDGDVHRIQSVDKWHTLVHVCRRWRVLVFASPRRLNLRLLCRGPRRVRAMLDIWPALPIEINDAWMGEWREVLDNIIAALEHPDRVRSIALRPSSSSAWNALVAAMQVPLPELTYLWLWSPGVSPVFPDSFLGGSARRLRTLKLANISFPAVSNLLLSASDLVDLSMLDIHSGYISPDAFVACLSSLNRLEYLRLGFKSRRSRPDQPSPPPQTRVVLPALTSLTFQGMADDLDDFLTRIDTPVLNKFSMSFFLDHAFDVTVPHLTQLTGQAKGLKPYKVARVALSRGSIQLSLTEPLPLSLGMVGDRICLKVHTMSLMCGQLSPFLCLVERLDLTANYWPSKSQGENDAVSSLFLELFQPFTAIRSLHVSEGLIPFIALALQQLIGPRAAEVLPKLCDLFLGGSAIPGTVLEAIRPFVDARQLSGQPIVIHHWEEKGADP
ncbi:hypothetical protein BC826DRAFT_1190147 [Russula brevipes]|nr:hypothetical protein BC826DRAFT_1190147 [Russula brevipes]